MHSTQSIHPHPQEHHAEGATHTPHHQARHVTTHQVTQLNSVHPITSKHSNSPYLRSKLVLFLGFLGVLLVTSSLIWQLLIAPNQNKNQALNPEFSNRAIESIEWESEADRVRVLAGIPNSDILSTQLEQQDLIISEAVALGLISLPDNYARLQDTKTEGFYQLKQALLDEARAEYAKKEAMISGTMVSVFYYNQKMPEIPFSQADQAAKKIAELARQLILSGMSVAEVKKSIHESPETPLLDFNYANNTLLEFANAKVSELFIDPVVISAIDELATASNNQVSEVFRSPGSAENFGLTYFTNSPRLNGHYFFLILTNKKDGFYQSFDSWTNSIISKDSNAE
jgi:hypothetical protein